MHFNLQRFTKYLKTNLLFSITRLKQPIIATTGVLVVILFIRGLLGSQVSEQTYSFTFSIFLLIGGIIISVRFFEEFHTAKKGFMTILLPVSVFEKLLTSWLITSVIYTVFILFFNWILLFLVALLLTIIKGFDLSSISLFSSSIRNTITLYMLLNVVFLAGSISFKTQAFFKTLITVIIINICLFIYSAVFGYSIFKDMMFTNFMFEGQSLMITGGSSSVNMYWTLVTCINCILLLFFTFYKLKEKQV